MGIHWDTIKRGITTISVLNETIIIFLFVVAIEIVVVIIVVSACLVININMEDGYHCLLIKRPTDIGNDIDVNSFCFCCCCCCC